MAMTAEEQIEYLTAQLKQALEQLQVAQDELNKAKERIAELEKQKTPPPSFVKANVKKPKAAEKKARKKREAQHNRARQQAQPTQVVDHRIVECPDCHLRLGGLSLDRVREVIDVPPAPRMEVTHHRIF